MSKFATRLREVMAREGVKSKDLVAATGLSYTIIREYTSGHYLPGLPEAQLLADALMAPDLVGLVKASRYRKCALASCRRPFWRKAGSPQKYCTPACQRLVGKGLRKVQPNPARDAIDEMCRSCEPEGTCRNDGCPLRPFSPLPFASLVHVSYVGDHERAARRAEWRKKWHERQERVA